MLHRKSILLLLLSTVIDVVHAQSFPTSSKYIQSLSTTLGTTSRKTNDDTNNNDSILIQELENTAGEAIESKFEEGVSKFINVVGGDDEDQAPQIESTQSEDKDETEAETEEEEFIVSNTTEIEPSDYGLNNSFSFNDTQGDEQIEQLQVDDEEAKDKGANVSSTLDNSGNADTEGELQNTTEETEKEHSSTNEPAVEQEEMQPDTDTIEKEEVEDGTTMTNEEDNGNKVHQTPSKANDSGGNNTNINFPKIDIDPEAVSLTVCDACEKAVAYIVNFDWNATLLSETKEEQPPDETLPLYILHVYLIQLIITPVSLVMVLFGSRLLLPISSLAAALLGIFVVFQFITDLGCSMKLSLSIVSAILCAFLAGAFVRFGLFALGAATAGIGSYFFFDLFPQFDPIVFFATKDELASGSMSTTYILDISPYGWGVIIFVALCGGIIVRWNEKVSLEFVTSVLGAIGSAYSLQSFVLVQGGQLSPAVVFLTASLLVIFGFRFQRHRRRLVDDPHYRNFHTEKNYQDDNPLPPPQQAPPVPSNSQPPTSQREYRDVKRQHESWEKLQKSVDSMNDMLARKAEMEQQEYERKRQNDELSLVDKVQLKNIIRDYNARARNTDDEFHDNDVEKDRNGKELEMC